MDIAPVIHRCYFVLRIGSGGTLDELLATCLLVLVPAYMLLRNRRPENVRPANRMNGMWRTSLLASGLLALLALSWLLNSRPVSALGLVVPLSPYAEAGLGLAVVALGGVAIAVLVQLRSPKTKAEDLAKALEGLPRTPQEAARYLPQIVLVCVAWELLYRGFLLWFLTPRIGLSGAVVASAAAYGLAHGYTGFGRFAASLMAALLFTVGYAATQSLWWLMLLHAGPPILGSIASVYRPGSGPPLQVSVADPVPPIA